jgi:hypothetical protein
VENDSSGFIDLILSHQEFPGDRLVLECKRNKSDDLRQVQWLFLLPESNFSQTGKASCLEVEGPLPQRQVEWPKIVPSPWRDIRIWDDVTVVPSSFQSEFCLLSGDEPKRQPILETLCGERLESIDGLAQEEVNINQSQKERKLRLFIFPVIGTNANLKACQFDPSDIQITDGTLNLQSVKIIDAPFIRFRKSLVTKFPEGNFTNLKEANRARERSVLVVNAQHLIEFLKAWKVTTTHFAIQKYLSNLGWG